MKASYEPNLVGGGVTGTVMALLVYYKVLDVEAAGLWAVLIGLIMPIAQASVTRLFTVATAKLRDAKLPHPTEITRMAKDNTECTK